MDDIKPPPSTRTIKGQFAPGNPGGPGGTHRRVAEMRKEIVKAISPADIAKVFSTLKKLSESGDLDAIKLLLQYSVGSSDRVAESVEREAREAAISAGMSQPATVAR